MNWKIKLLVLMLLGFSSCGGAYKLSDCIRYLDCDRTAMKKALEEPIVPPEI
jgi:hypothetical protein